MRTRVASTGFPGSEKESKESERVREGKMKEDLSHFPRSDGEGREEEMN